MYKIGTNEYLSLSEVADLLGTSRSGTSRLASKGVLPFIRHPESGFRLFREQDVRDLLEHYQQAEKEGFAQK